MAVGTVIKATGNIVNGVRQNVAAKKELKKQDQIAKDRQAAFEELQKNRQEVINPYGNMANEFENLGVATQSAQFQAEEADIALANTLDTIMQTGGGAGGATALARMALESKRGISQSIEQQEAANQKARAQGAADVAALKAEGEVFKFNAQEQRDNAELERLYSEQKDAEFRGDQANLAKMAANTQMINSTANLAGTIASSAVGNPGNALGGLLNIG